MHPILVELRANQISTQNLEVIEKVLQEEAPSFKIDLNYPLIPMNDQDNELSSYLVRGEIDEIQLNQLKTSKDVLEVFKDTPVSPFG